MPPKVKPTAPTAKTTTKATGKPKATAKRDTGERGAKRAKRRSGLDAAAQILAAAIEREITAKGDGSRFRKIARGRFELAR